MQHNKTEIKQMFDAGVLSRSIIESETSMKKCNMFSEMAEDKEVKAFFKDQSKALDALVDFFKGRLADYN